MARTRKLTKEQIEAQEAETKKVLDTLAELSGSKLTDDQVTRKGTQLILPATMDPAEAIEFLHDYVEQMETATEFSRTFRYRPWDGAVALQRALLRVTGTTGLAKGSYSFFGYDPPEMRTINVGHDDTMQVPWGRIAVPMIDGMMVVTTMPHPTWGPLFHLSVTCPRKFKGAVEGLFNVVEEELKRESIYKGSAIDGQVDPEFLDLAGVDPNQVIYSEETERQLAANIWSVIRFTSRLRDLGLSRKRAVLLEGPYGTGKTLAAFLTAQEAVKHGWTFLYCRPARDNLANVMSTARLYQPAVVFFEDVDVMTTEDADRDAVSQLLDLFDGITAKSTEIMVVLTTNHKERIHRAMIRPGRLDAVVHIGAYDRIAVERMIDISVPSDKREALDYERIAEAMEGFLPAFVKEATDRAMRYAIARNDGEVGVLNTQDFVDAADGLRPQLDLMEGASEGTGPETLARALRHEVESALHNSPLVYPDTTDPVMVLQTQENETNGAA
jgi:transitional endoplasmic reticulum ATPase